MPKSDQKKAAALAALMECDTFTEAAEKAEISRKTLYNYLTEDQEFATAYRAMQERRTLERADKAEANYNAAVQTVLELMEYGKAPPAVRLKAALSLMDSTTEAREKTKELAQRNRERTNPLNPFADTFDL